MDTFIVSRTIGNLFNFDINFLQTFLQQCHCEFLLLSTLNRLYSSSVSRNVLESSAIVTESTRMCFTSESSAYYSIGNGPVPSSAARHDCVATIRHHRESRQQPTGILPEFYS